MPATQPGGLLQRCQVAAMAGPVRQRRRGRAQQRRGQQRCGQRAHLRGASLVGQVEAQHHRMLPQHVGEQAIVVQLGPQGLPARLEAGVVAQRALRQPVHRGQAGALVGLGQHQVQPDQAGAALVHRGAQQVCQLPAWPRPAAVRRQRTFVDVDHHHLGVCSGRRQPAQAHVVQGVVQRPQRPAGPPGQADQQQRQCQGPGDRVSPEVARAATRRSRVSGS